MLGVRGVSCGVILGRKFSGSRSRSLTSGRVRRPCQSLYTISQWKKNLKSPTPRDTSVMTFQTSSPRRLHPLLALVIIKPLTRVVSAATGWAVKRWWGNLTKEDKLKIKTHFVRNKIRYGGLLLFLLGTCYTLYENNVVTNPYTGRKRFMLYNATQLSVLGMQKFDRVIGLSYGIGSLMPPSAEFSQGMIAILNQLLISNVDFKEVQNRQWKLYIIDDESQYDVAAFASGEIVFCTGMLDLIENVDQVAHLLAHEMSHVILEHHAENASHGYLLSSLMMLPFALFWAVIPSNIVAAISSWIFEKSAELLVSSVYSREQEKEADAFSLNLMAKACFDVREASVFWGNMAFRTEQSGIGNSGKWLATHPSHAQRQANLDGQMLDAIMIRHSWKCSELPAMDPRFPLWKRERLKTIKSLQQDTQTDVKGNAEGKSKEDVNAETDDEPEEDVKTGTDDKPKEDVNTETEVKPKEDVNTETEDKPKEDVNTETEDKLKKNDSVQTENETKKNVKGFTKDKLVEDFKSVTEDKPKKDVNRDTEDKPREDSVKSENHKCQPLATQSIEEIHQRENSRG